IRLENSSRSDTYERLRLTRLERTKAQACVFSPAPSFKQLKSEPKRPPPPNEGGGARHPPRRLRPWRATAPHHPFSKGGGLLHATTFNAELFRPEYSESEGSHPNEACFGGHDFGSHAHPAPLQAPTRTTRHALVR